MEENKNKKSAFGAFVPFFVILAGAGTFFGLIQYVVWPLVFPK